MSSVKSELQAGAVVLGQVGAVASWRRANNQVAGMVYRPMVVIQCASEEGLAGHTPAASMAVIGRDELLALRSAIDEALKEPAQ